jgi:hypothetical protein
MRWKVAYTRHLLIAVALCAGIGYSVKLTRQDRPTDIVMAIGKPFLISDTNLVFTMKELHGAGNEFVGSVLVQVDPSANPAAKTSDLGYSKVSLRVDHCEAHSCIDEGQSDNPISLSPSNDPLRREWSGNGDFMWKAVPITSSFFYPFDRYTLHVNPMLLQIREANADRFYTSYISIVKVNFGNTNFQPHLSRFNPDPQADPYQIELGRPPILQALVICVAFLLAVWLVHLIVAKAEEHTGQIISLFLGVFTIRSLLLGGAPVFPSLIDYCALSVYLVAALVVLVKNAFPDPPGQVCPHCKSPLPDGACVCPQCTRDIKTTSVTEIPRTSSG